MKNLHVVYRVDHTDAGDDTWSTYSYPDGIYVGGSTLDEVRAEFRDAAAFALDDDPDVTLVEHLERQLIPGAYVRVAVDRHMLDRDEVANAMAGTLTHELQRKDFEATAPLMATGDAVLVACIPSDSLGWLSEQMSDQDALAICAKGELVGALRRVWWSYIAGPEAVVPGGRPSDSLAAAGLKPDSTVVEFMLANKSATGRSLVGASA